MPTCRLAPPGENAPRPPRRNGHPPEVIADSGDSDVSGKDPLRCRGNACWPRLPLGLQGWVLRPLTEAGGGGGGESEKMAGAFATCPAQLQQLGCPFGPLGDGAASVLRFPFSGGGGRLTRSWWWGAEADGVLAGGAGQVAGLSAVSVLGCYSSRSSQAPVLPALLSHRPLQPTLSLRGPPAQPLSDLCLPLSPRDGG